MDAAEGPGGEREDQEAADFVAGFPGHGAGLAQGFL